MKYIINNHINTTLGDIIFWVTGCYTGYHELLADIESHVV